MKLKNILMPSWATEITEYSNPVSIISTAATASSNDLGGRLIPHVILDSSITPALDELIRVHEFLPPGDVNVTWGINKEKKGFIMLRLLFEKPLETPLHLEFEIKKHGGLVDQIFSSRILGILTGKLGERFRDKLDAPSITVEIPDTGFFKVWDEMFFKNTTKRMRESGLGRQEAKRAARQYIDHWREFGSFRA